MKKRLVLIASLIFVFCCFFAICVNAQCQTCTDSWVVDTGSQGYLGEITAVNTCTVCNTVTSEVIPPLFYTLGYSYSEMGGMTQHFAADRDAIKRYEEITGEEVRFGAVVATRNNVSGNPLDENGNPVSSKVKVADLTETEYDVFDVMVSAIPADHWEQTQIICCAYIIAGNEITYIDNGVEKINAAANTLEAVKKKVDNGEKELPQIETYRIINGVKYRTLSLEDLDILVHAYWNSSGGTEINVGSSGTALSFAATRKFTKEELPNGTIIWVGSGWQYRPDGWKNGQKNSSTEKDEEGYRPKTVKTTTVVVNDAWWRELDTRGFNISKTSGSIANTVTPADIYKIFKIYVPVGKITVDDTTPDEEEKFDPTADKEKQDWASDGALKILTIGNSFSDDSMEYVYQIAKSLGVEKVVLGNLYIGGCTLSTHFKQCKK